MKISATEPDWDRERPRGLWDPSRRLLRAIRAYQSGGFVVRRLAVLRHRFWSVVTGADIALTTQIAGGLKLPHPNGVVVHPRTTIGPNCIIFQQVTLGVNMGDRRPPQIGGRVDIGPGARVLGGVRVGDGAVIAANAVVLEDVPPMAVVAGMPARVVGERGKDT